VPCGGFVAVDDAAALRAAGDGEMVRLRVPGRGARAAAAAAASIHAPLISSAAQGWPLMLKARRAGYDGRGNRVVSCAADAAAAFAELAPGGGGGGVFAEAWVPYVRELAVVCVRARDGGLDAFAPVATVQTDSVCALVVAPAPSRADVLARARQVALAAVAALPPGAGVYGVELFELADGRVLLNELAPRVHNSGHLTIEACACSQFEAHVRAVCGLPAGDLRARVPAAAMVNVLGVRDGAGGCDAAATWAPCARALRTPGAALHWYGKAAARAGRKMGHVTVTGDSAMEAAARAHAVLGAAPPPPAAVAGALAARAPLVAIIMGSDSDLPTLAPAASTLDAFGVPYELTVVSAHRTPDRMVAYARAARGRGLQVIIAAAGGAAHLPGMVAALTTLPVIGVPVPLKHLDGVDSLHSMVQMPRGVPVAVVAIGNATNAALLAARILGARVPHLAAALDAYAAAADAEVLAKAAALEEQGWKAYAAAMPKPAH
jgi:phosphoribosylaminoimidazole carboxylase